MTTRNKTVTVDDVIKQIASTHRRIFLTDNDPSLHIEQMNNYLKLSDVKSAAYHVKKAMQISEKDEYKITLAHIYDMLGLIFTRSGKNDEAEQAFSDAIRLVEKEWSFWAHWSIPALQRSDWKCAIERLDKAITLCSRENSKPLLMMIAYAYLIDGEEQISKSYCLECLDIDPRYSHAVQFMQDFQDRVDALCNQASLLSKKGKFVEASRVMAEAIKIQPESALLRCQRASYLRMGGSILKGKKEMTKLLTEVETDSERKAVNKELALLLNDEAIIALSEGNFEKSLSLLADAISADEQAAIIRKNRGDCFREMGDLPSAMKDYLIALKLNPGDEETLYRIAQIHAYFGKELLEAGRIEESLVEMDLAIECLPFYRSSVMTQYSPSTRAQTSVLSSSFFVLPQPSHSIASSSSSSSYSESSTSPQSASRSSAQAMTEDLSHSIFAPLQLFLQRADVLMRLGRMKDAFSDLEWEYKLNPDSPEVEQRIKQFMPQSMTHPSEHPFSSIPSFDSSSISSSSPRHIRVSSSNQSRPLRPLPLPDCLVQSRQKSKEFERFCAQPIPHGPPKAKIILQKSEKKTWKDRSKSSEASTQHFLLPQQRKEDNYDSPTNKMRITPTSSILPTLPPQASVPPKPPEIITTSSSRPQTEDEKRMQNRSGGVASFQLESRFHI
ncbi:uncharacterized protein MONOS_2792 [Monocercomonoides exilis]|uniref:uncharacterized protein n=1 Tax=Monocercomonoides exilis TaxID=2049356 RepID=UPI0035597428|nr:hypothetical protein MONOS_2792 [Monocercomonoides exilis]